MKRIFAQIDKGNLNIQH